MRKKITGYELSRNWFDFCFENPEMVSPTHTALYFFAIEHCNRLGWKEKFGMPTEMAKDAIGVKSWHTYIKAFNDIVEWGFFKLIQRSKNQYSSNIIALTKNIKAHNKALDKALTKHSSKHSSKQGRSKHQSKDSIDKQINKEPLNHKQENKDVPLFVEKGFENVWTEWIGFRKKIKKPVREESLEKQFKKIKQLSGGCPKMAQEIVDQSIERGWQGLFEIQNCKNGKSNHVTASKSIAFTDHYSEVL
jgi:hypothetical protein